MRRNQHVGALQLDAARHLDPLEAGAGEDCADRDRIGEVRPFEIDLLEPGTSRSMPASRAPASFARAKVGAVRLDAPRGGAILA